jgi:hypothetical protein
MEVKHLEEGLTVDVALFTYTVIKIRKSQICKLVQNTYSDQADLVAFSGLTST